MGTTYEEIKKKLKEYQAEGTTNKIKAVRTVNTLFDLCRKYCKYRPEEFSEVIDSLKDKIDNDKKFNCTNTAEELTVSGKMYIDFFTKHIFVIMEMKKSLLANFIIFSSWRENMNLKFLKY